MNARAWRSHAWANRLQSLLLVALLLGIGAMAGHLLLGDLGLWLALGAGTAALLAEPAAGAGLTLRLFGARPLSPPAAPLLWRTLEVLAERAGLPAVPHPYYIASPSLNAFAVGQREASAVAITDGLLKTLDHRQLSGVLAHEVAHIAHGDLRVMNLAAQVGRLTALFSLTGQFLLLISLPSLLNEGWWRVDWVALALLLFSPQITLLAQLGLSRVREFDADMKAAALTGDPTGLAMALTSIEQASRPWYARLLPPMAQTQPTWLRSHPETRQRVDRLLALDTAATGRGI